MGVYNFVVSGLGSSGDSCARVEIRKDQSTTPINVVVTADGYNVGDENCDSTSNRRVERELVVSSRVGSTPLYTPPSSTVDLKCNGSSDSCSIAYNSSPLLSWTTSASITSCTAVTNGAWTGSKSWPTGNQTISNLTSTQTYTINCSGESGAVSDSVVVTVLAANVAPVAYAGLDKSITLPTSSSAPTGTSATDTPPGTVSTTVWTQVGSTPSVATITSGTTLAPTFSGLSVAGTYTFRLTATDNQGATHSDDMSVVVSAAAPSRCLATGGTITYTDSNGLNPRSSPSYTGGYAVNTFTTSGTFSQGCAQTVSYLLVAGGGSGASVTGQTGGGGGGGEVISGTAALASGSSFPITIGSGGTNGGSGGNTVAAGITLRGGGGGGCCGNPTAASGGSGAGGKSGHFGPYAGGSSTSVSPGLGFAGGSGNDYGAGGGGGAGAAGQTAWFTWPDNHGGNGGAGYTSSISGVSRAYGAGGGGAGGNTYSGGAAGSGGSGGSGVGGNGATFVNDEWCNSNPGGAATGYGNGGGGAAGSGAYGSGCDSAVVSGGAGSPGVVIIRYAYP